MAYLYIKFEESNFARSKDVKEDPERQIGRLAVIGLLKVIGNVTF